MSIPIAILNNLHLAFDSSKRVHPEFQSAATLANRIVIASNHLFSSEVGSDHLKDLSYGIAADILRMLTDFCE